MIKFLWLGMVLAGAAQASQIPDPSRTAEKAERHFRAGLKMLDQSRFKDAADELKVASLLSPDRADIQDALHNAQDPSRLQAPGSRLNPAALQARKPLADARQAYRMSDLARAAMSWKLSLEMEPGNAEATEGLARLAQEKYRKDADRPFDSTVEEFYEGALREARKERYSEALKKLQNALALNPTQPQCKELLARIRSGAFAEQGSMELAESLRQAEKAMSASDWAAARLELERAQKAAPQDKLVQAAWLRWRERSRPSLEDLLERAAKAKDDPARIKLYKKALELDPADAIALEELQRSEGRLKQARDDSKQQKRSNTFYRKGMEAWQAGRLAEAADDLKSALVLAPDDGEIQKALEGVRRGLLNQVAKDEASSEEWMLKARDLEAKGNLREAQEAYARALARDEQNAEARESGARLRKLMDGN